MGRGIFLDKLSETSHFKGMKKMIYLDVSHQSFLLLLLKKTLLIMQIITKGPQKCSHLSSVTYLHLNFNQENLSQAQVLFI